MPDSPESVAYQSPREGPGSVLARRVLMVRPNGFAFNQETATTNAFMAEGDPAGAMAEFDGLVHALRDAGIEVVIWEGTPDAPDAVFVNNWISSHENGAVVLYPMRSPSRRRERRALPEDLKVRYGFLDLTFWEGERLFLEGTGSLVLDRAHRVAYNSISPRTRPVAVARWCSAMGYWNVSFQARDREGVPIYHTNVVLSVGTDWAVVCTEACKGCTRAMGDLRHDGKQVIEIGFDQLEAFCGNVIELEGVIVASTRAWEAFTPEQRAILSRNRRPVVADVSTFERVGGGSVRCMIAEWFV